MDEESLTDFERNLEGNLYKIWNRMLSGSYIPPAVRAVSIPKKSGGNRVLGIPTVSDRIAQMVVKLVFEPEIEPHFLFDSYGYRPNKSALDAVAVTRLLPLSFLLHQTIGEIENSRCLSGKRKKSQIHI